MAFNDDINMIPDIEESKKRKGRGYKRKLWTQKEDHAITKLVDVIGECNWGTIAEKMHKDYGIKGRTGKQCRERWHNHLSPEVKKEPLTQNEENEIFLLHINKGYKWAEIAKELGKRTDNAIKNHFYATLRRYMRRTNKILKSDAFKNLTNYPWCKVTCDYIYKWLMEGKIQYDELKTVDSDKWQWIQKQFLKHLSQKKNEQEFQDLKEKLNLIVKDRISNNSLVRQDSMNDDGSASRRSSRLTHKKRNNYSEDTENFNLYLMLELVNYEPAGKSNGNKRTASKVERSVSKRFKINEAGDGLMIKKKQPSNVFSNNSFGDTRKPSTKLQNPKLDKILQNEESDDNDSDKDSLDMNIGKTIKMTTKGNKIQVGKKSQGRELSSMSFLQDARNISKTSSMGHQKVPSFVRFGSHMNQNSIDYGMANLFGRNNSNLFEKYGQSPLTRNKTKVFNYDIFTKFGREESDPNYLSFAPWTAPFDLKPIDISNPMSINVVREISNAKKANFKSDGSEMPPLKTENLEVPKLAESRKSSVPHNISHSHTASFGEKSMKSSRNISLPIVTRSKSKVQPVSKFKWNTKKKSFLSNPHKIRSTSVTRLMKGRIDN